MPSEPAHPASTAVLPASAGQAPKERPVLRGWFHLVAAVVMLVAGAFLVAAGPTAGIRAALIVYVVCMLALFSVSAAFHRVRWSPPARRRMRRADHSTIFLAIAGTSTAISALALSGWALWTLLAVAWAGAAVGITLRQCWLDAPKWAVALPYVVVGWSALLVVPQLIAGLGAAGFLLLVAGGLAYTAGAIVYAGKRPDPVPSVFGYHEVFHACTLVGAALQFAVIAWIALPRT